MIMILDWKSYLKPYKCVEMISIKWEYLLVKLTNIIYRYIHNLTRFDAKSNIFQTFVRELLRVDATDLVANIEEDMEAIISNLPYA